MQHISLRWFNVLVKKANIICGLCVRLTQTREAQGYFLSNLSRIVKLKKKWEVLVIRTKSLYILHLFRKYKKIVLAFWNKQELVYLQAIVWKTKYNLELCSKTPGCVHAEDTKICLLTFSAWNMLINFWYCFSFLTNLKMEQERPKLHIQVGSDKIFISFLSWHYIRDR